jgi:hypothetical protein
VLLGLPAVGARWPEHDGANRCCCKLDHFAEGVCIVWLLKKSIFSGVFSRSLYLLGP